MKQYGRITCRTVETMNTYTHLGLDDAQNEMVRLQLVESARAEQDQLEGKAKGSEKVIKLG